MAGKKRKDRRRKRPRDDSEKNPISSTCTSSEANVKGGDVDDKVTSQVPVEESKPTHQEASTFAVTQTQERKRKKKRKRKNGSLNDSSPSKKQKLKGMSESHTVCVETLYSLESEQACIEAVRVVFSFRFDAVNNRARRMRRE